MEDFEKKLKNRLQNATSSGRIDADDLWSDIAENIKKEDTSKKRWMFWLLTLLMLLISLGFALYISNFNQPNVQDNKPNYTDSSVKNSEKPELEAKQLNNKAKVQAEKLKEREPIREQQNSLEEPSLTKQEKQLNRKEIQAKSMNDALQSIPNTLISVSTFDGINDSNKEDSNEAIPTAKVDHQQNSAPTKNGEPLLITDSDISNRILNSVKTLPGLTLQLLPIEKQSRVSSKLVEVKVGSKRKRLSFGLFGGGYVLFNSFKESTDNTFAKALEDSFTPETSYSISGEVNYDLNRIFSVKTGLEYFQATERFDYTRIWDTLIWRIDTVDPELIDAEGLRVVRHYNKHTFISVPLMIGLNFRKNRLHYGLYAGASFNFTSSQEGKILNPQEQLIAFSNNSDLLPKPDFYMAYQMQPFLGYRLSKDITLNLRADIRWQNYGQSSLLGLRQSSVLTGLGLGFIYTP